MFRAVIAAMGAIGLSLTTAPVASARTLEAIYEDMLTLNASKPCETSTPATPTCKASLQPKVDLANEVQPMLAAMPSPPRSPVANGLNNMRHINTSVDEYIADYCNSFPNLVAKLTSCTGDSIQNNFDGMTQNVGMIVGGQ